MTLKATCHCGDTQIALSRVPDSAKSCNCSYCHRTGAIWGYFQPDEVTVEEIDGRSGW